MAMNPQPSPDTSPNKRVKILIPDSDLPSSISKGKSKIEEETFLPVHEGIDNESADCCGICLSEDVNGGVSRGFIDSCNHYFCFVCVMEWAKVESKCPLCKRRFSTITRPPKPPIFTSERVVHVPVRDQVYQNFGNASTGPANLYSEAKCSVCQGIADESLLLLCDLCDCAAHTYCVGLGATVPECDWFCQDCTLLKDEHMRSETNTESSVQTSLDPACKVASPNEPVSVFDIVREPCDPALRRYRTTSSTSYCLPCHRSTNGEIRESSNVDRIGTRRVETVTQHPPKPNARTLRHCRNLQDRIRSMRENWNGFRRGTIHFASSQGHANTPIQKSTSSASGSHSVSSFNVQSIAPSSSFDVKDNARAQEIEKAWKMMDRAKSIQKNCQRSNAGQYELKCNGTEANAVKNNDYVTHSHLSPNCRQNRPNNFGSTKPAHNYHSPRKDDHRQPYSVSRKLNWRRQMLEGVNSNEVPIIATSSNPQELESSKGSQTPSSVCADPVRIDVKFLETNSSKSSTCLSSSFTLEPTVLKLDVKRDNLTSSSHNNRKQPVDKKELKKFCVDSKKYNDAKSEIQSLVKLNLKLQTEDDKLEVDVFKEVARLATHSILGACGLELQKPGYCSIPGFVCSHPIEVWQLHKSSLMPNTCRECFYAFVKDMVNTVLLQKKKNTTKSLAKSS